MPRSPSPNSYSRFMQCKPLYPESPIETEFARMLREAGIPESDAHKYLMVQQWVRRNCRSKFVPVSILEACGIRPEEIA